MTQPRKTRKLTAVFGLSAERSPEGKKAYEIASSNISSMFVGSYQRTNPKQRAQAEY